MDFMTNTVGFRNNNPGNIRNADEWLGLSDTLNHQSFCVFDSVEWGIRAIYKTLLTYRNKHRLYNVHDIINRWAPTHENNTASYIHSVVRSINLGLIDAGDDEGITSMDDIWEQDLVHGLIAAIIHHENGLQPFSDDFIGSCMCMGEEIYNA